MTEVRGLYSIQGGFSDGLFYIFSSKSGRYLLCDGKTVGRDFRRALMDASFESLSALFGILSDNQKFDPTLAHSIDVVNILRGGLNFGLHDVMERLTGRAPRVSFSAREREVVGGSVKVRTNIYDQIQVDGCGILVIGDICATGSTMISVISELINRMEDADKDGKVLVIVCIGTLQALYTLDEFFTQAAERLEAVGVSDIRVVLLEGVFNIYDESMVPTAFHLNATDFTRSNAVLAPEYVLASLSDIASVFERCVIYDGGERGFTPARHLSELRAYWTGVETLASGPIDDVEKFVSKKMDFVGRASSFADWLHGKNSWSRLPVSLIEQVYREELSFPDTEEVARALGAICARRLMEIGAICS